MNYLKTIFLVITAISFAIPGPSSARVYIDINSPDMQKFPIAITDFQSQGTPSDRENLSVWFSDQLVRALKVTNYFAIIDKKAYLEAPGGGGMTSQTIRFSDWTAIGAESLVKGKYQYNGKELTAEFMLFDVVLGKMIVGKKYTGSLQDRRRMVLKFSNEILLALTGERGVFDTKVAFTGKKGNALDVYTIDFDGSGLERLTDLNTISILPRWSPDGRQIAFTCYKNGNPDLFLINAKGGKEKQISSSRGLNMAGAWAPDGKSLLVTSSRDGEEEIYLLSLPDCRMKRLTHDSSINVSPSWSPDGRRIAFVSNRDGSPQIYTMDADGGNVKRLTSEGNYNTSPRWSPKGDRIVFEGRKNGSFQIMSIDVTGVNLTQLTSEGRNESPSWSPDGRYIAFVSTGKGKSKLCVMNANGTNLRTLHDGMEKYLSPYWSPRLNYN